MVTRKTGFSSIGRAVAVATVAAVASTAIGPSLALAAPARKGPSAATHNATDFSSRGRLYRGGGGAAAAAFAGIVGTGIAIAASQNRRAYYDDYYGGGPAYYGGGPYYGGTPTTAAVMDTAARPFPISTDIRSPVGKRGVTSYPPVATRGRRFFYFSGGMETGR